MLGTFDFYGASALVAAVGAIVASVLTFLARKPAAVAATDAANTAAAVTMSNGKTIAGAVEDIATNVAMPGTCGTIAEHVEQIAKNTNADLAGGPSTNPPPHAA